MTPAVFAEKKDREGWAHRVKAGKSRKILVLGIVGAWIAGLGGCATLTGAPPADPVPPEYVFAAHPDGWDEADLHAIFYDKKSPSLSSLRGCDADFRKLRAATRSNEEFQEGLTELITKDPAGYHWCFYGQLAWLDEDLKQLKYTDEKQKQVLKVFEFLTPVSRVFTSHFNDSRYLRWAVLRYKHLSEWVFYRKLALSPRTTAELVEMSNPYGLVRPPVGKTHVIDKYKIEPKPLFVSQDAAAAAPPTAPLADSARTPATGTTPTPEASPSPAPSAAPPAASAVEPGTPADAQTAQPVPPPGQPEANAAPQAAAPEPAAPQAAATEALPPPPPSAAVEPAPSADAASAAPADPAMEAPPLPGEPSARAPAAEPPQAVTQ